MKSLIKPLSLMGAGVVLGMSLFIGANIGKALMKLASTGSVGPRERVKH